jgi:hypothetical protein
VSSSPHEYPRPRTTRRYLSRREAELLAGFAIESPEMSTSIIPVNPEAYPTKTTVTH